MIARKEIWNYLDNGQVWAGIYKNSQNMLHWHYDCELVQVKEGAIDVYCDRRKYTLTKGQSLFIDSGQVHYMHAHTTDTLLYTIVFDDVLLRPFAEKIRLSSPKLYGNYPVDELYTTLKHILSDKKTFYTTEASCEVTKMMIWIFRNERLIKRSSVDSTAQAFKSLLEEISEKYRYYTFDDAVSFMGMSDAYFSRYFRSMAGVTFSQYLNFVRTERAVEMIQANRSVPVTEISDQCGFGTIRNFNRIFKELTGFPPSQIPQDFLLKQEFIPASDSAFHPTLGDCDLYESPTPPPVKQGT